MSKYIHKSETTYKQTKGDETIFMSKYKHKAMKQYLCLNINTRQ